MTYYLLIPYILLLSLALALRWLYKKIAFRRRCPNCSSLDVERMARKGWIRYVRIIKPFKCRECNRYFVQVSLRKSGPKVRVKAASASR